MSIRRKLFYAFIGVVAVPLAVAAVLARHYLTWERGELDRRFVEQATATFRSMGEASTRRADELAALVHQALLELDDDEGGITIQVDPVPEPPEPPEPGAPGAPPLAGAARRPSFHVAAAMPESIRALRRSSPEIRGVELYEAEGVLYSDLADDAGARLIHRPDQRPLDLAPRVFELEGGRRFIHDRLGAGVGRHLIAEIDPAALVRPGALYKTGAAVYFAREHGLYAPVGPGVPVNLARPAAAMSLGLPPDGELATVKDNNWVHWRVYTAPSSETDGSRYLRGARLVALAPEDEVYAPLVWFRVEIYGALFASLVIAAWLAYFLSGRLVGAVERIRSGVDALSRGEWTQLDKLSGDELGSGLVESVNHMAQALAERMRKEEVEGWRRLVRVLSHEINNTLGPVRSVAVTVRDQVAGRVPADAAEDLRAAFQLIVDRTDALGGFIAGYAELAKLPEPERADADFRAVVEGAVRLFADEAERSGITLRVDAGKDPLPARVDPGQLERVVINLVKNALEAASSGGTVRVAAAARPGSVELLVDDDGPGIGLEARRHLFVPYFTTKPGGSGIGLALVRQIVLGHGGTVAAEDRPGGGARLRVTLPTQR